MSCARHSIRAASTLAAATLVLAACSPGPDELDSAVDAPAEAACLVAIENTTNGGIASVLSTKPLDDGTEVLVAVEGVEAPWSCEVGRDGSTVIGVQYTGSEGYL